MTATNQLPKKYELTPGRKIRIISQSDGRKLFDWAKVHFVSQPDGKVFRFCCARCTNR